MPKPIQWTTPLIEKFWSTIAQTRLSELSFGKTGGHTLIALIQKHLPAGATVLDYGAGDGDLIPVLLEHGFKVAVCEPSQGRRESILKRPDIHSERFLGVIAPEDEGVFDVVLCSEVIEHVLPEAAQDFLESLRARLKPGGTLVVTTPHDEDLDLSASYCPNCDSIFHRWQHVRSFTRETLRDELTKGGFDVVSIRAADISGQVQLYMLREQVQYFLNQNIVKRLKAAMNKRLFPAILPENSISVIQGVDDGSILVAVARKSLEA